MDGELGASTHFARAMLAAALGRDQLCLDMLEQAMDRRELSAVWIRTDARLDRLRHVPRFSVLMERLNAFVPTGTTGLADPLATVQP